MKFYAKYALINNFLSEYFYKNLRLSIKLLIEKKDWKLDIWITYLKK